MHFKKIFLAIIAFAFVSMTSQPEPNEMLADLNFIGRLLQNHYSFRDWKKELLGVDLNEELKKAQKKIILGDVKSFSEFHQLISNFLKNFHDYHLQARFATDEASLLPFTIKGRDGRYFITDVIQKCLPPKVKLHKGDEILSINGLPVEAVVQQLQKSIFGTTKNATDRALTEQILTRRIAAFGDPIEKGKIKIKKKKKEGKKSKGEYTLDWFHLPAFFDKQKLKNTLFEPIEIKSENSKQLLAQIPRYQKRFKIDTLFRNSIGAKKAPIPHLGNVVWEACENEPYHCYIWEGEEGMMVGYLRIHDFSWSKKKYLSFKDLVVFMEENTDALVIDITNNPGGEAAYGHAVARHLGNQVKIPIKQSLLLTLNDAHIAVRELDRAELISTDAEAKEVFGKSYAGYPVNLEFVKKYIAHYRFLLSEWYDGKVLSSPFNLPGIDLLQPDQEVCYSKPILILVNECCFSCADLFPLLMQENHCATLMGTKTAGAAGGYFKDVSFPNLNGLVFIKCPDSFFQYTNGDPVENFGIKPDIVCDITLKDLQNNYTSYIQSVRDSVRCVVNQQ